MNDELEKEILEIIAHSPLDFDVSHAQKTLEWLLKLKPEADDVLQIAALAHDIERGSTGITESHDLKDFSDIARFKREHAQRSADIAIGLLRKYNYSEEDIERVGHLIEKHEEGGNENANVLMEADSIAFFDHVERYYEKNGKDRTKDKIKFMISRVSDKAKKIIKDLEFNNPEVKKIVEELL